MKEGGDKLMIRKVFVYGSLKSGFSRDKKIFEKLRDPQKATLKGATMYRFPSFPGIKLIGDGVIKGELHSYPTVKDFSKVLKIMDIIEGVAEGLFSREEVTVDLEDGTQEKAWVYVVQFGTDNFEVIEEGEWKDE